jgi:polar amino acid transport system substrate-binding protein
MRTPALLAASALLALASSSAIADTITLKADSWCPYTCEPSSDKPGYMIEVAKAILEPKGHKVVYQNAPWARVLSEIREGKEWGAPGASDSDNEGTVLGGNFGPFQNCLFTSKGSGFKYEGIKSFAGKTLGVIKDYTYGEPFDAYIKANRANAKLVSEATGDDVLQFNLKKLAAKRLDYLLDDGNVVAMTAKLHGKDGEIESIHCENSQNLHIAFGEKNPKAKEWAKLLDEGVPSLRASGKLKEILSKYGVKDWK